MATTVILKTVGIVIPIYIAGTIGGFIIFNIALQIKRFVFARHWQQGFKDAFDAKDTPIERFMFWTLWGSGTIAYGLWAYKYITR